MYAGIRLTSPSNVSKGSIQQLHGHKIRAKCDDVNLGEVGTTTTIQLAPHRQKKNCAREGWVWLTA